MKHQKQYEITVITPVYNRARLLEKLFESLNNQTDNNFQWLIIDDGSEDNTKKVVDSFFKRSKIRQIVYQKKKNIRQNDLIPVNTKRVKFVKVVYDEFFVHGESNYQNNMKNLVLNLDIQKAMRR